LQQHNNSQPESPSYRQPSQHYTPSFPPPNATNLTDLRNFFTPGDVLGDPFRDFITDPHVLNPLPIAYVIASVRRDRLECWAVRASHAPAAQFIELGYADSDNSSPAGPHMPAVINPLGSMRVPPGSYMDAYPRVSVLDPGGRWLRYGRLEGRSYWRIMCLQQALNAMLDEELDVVRMERAGLDVGAVKELRGTFGKMPEIYVTSWKELRAKTKHAATLDGGIDVVQTQRLGLDVDAMKAARGSFAPVPEEYAKAWRELLAETDHASNLHESTQPQYASGESTRAAPPNLASPTESQIRNPEKSARSETQPSHLDLLSRYGPIALSNNTIGSITIHIHSPFHPGDVGS